MLQGYPDGLLHVMDAYTGEDLWTFQTGAGVHTTPITYEVAGEQFIAVLAGGQFYPYYDSPRDAIPDLASEPRAPWLQAAALVTG
jgi:glucose dehydrogenase